MSKTIDEKVVSLKLDNKQFESNASTSMSTLDKLKDKLNFKGVSKGVNTLDSAVKSVDMSVLGRGVETVATKFSSLQVMGVTALANITNSAVNAGKRIVSALTIDPIKTGFSEYETQINAVQTILANTESKGTTLQQVNSALDTLNTYADKTIYNFTEMTKNIGTFTAAGVDLDTSVQAIQGIANLAAVSGSTSQQASTAMYQLSQALSSGTVKLMDWNSVVNAGMGGQVFQDALKETAANHGVAIEQMIKDEGSFRETLKNGWLTSEILTETLSHFTMAAEEGTKEWEAYKKSLMDQGYTAKQAEEIIKLSNTATNAATKVKTFTQLWDTLKESAQSGWTQSWEILVGDFEEAKGFLTEVSDKIGGMISDSAEARNKILSEGLSSGWKQLMSAGIADEEGYKETLKTIADDHGVSIDKMVAKEKELDSSLSDSEAYQKALKKGLTDGSISADMMSESVHKMADKMSKMSAEELKAAGYTQEHVDKIKKLSEGLKKGEISMDDFVKKMTRTSGRENIIQALWNAFDGLMSVIDPIKQAFGEIFEPLKGEQLYSFTETLVKFTEKLTLSSEQSENLKRTFKGVFAVFDIVLQVVKAVGSAFGKLLRYILPAGDGFLGLTASVGDCLVEFSEMIEKSNVLGKIVEGIEKILKPVAEGVKSFGRTVSDTFKSISDKAEVRFAPLTALGNALKAIFIALGKVVQKVAPIFIALATKIGEAFRAMQERISGAIQATDYNAIFDIFNGGIFAAIGIGIAKFVNKLSSIAKDTKGFVEGLKDIKDAVVDTFGALQTSLKADMIKKIAIAIGILAASLFVISLIDSEKLTASLGAVAILFGELMGSVYAFEKIASKDGFKGVGKLSFAMIGLSSALLILSFALKIMSTMSWSEMGVGLISMATGLGLLVGAVNLLPEKDINKAAKAIKKLSSAMVVLAIALKIMGSMSWKEMGVGLISMATGLGLMVGAVHLLPSDTSKRAAGLFGLSVAMIALGAALKIMGSMSWIEIGKGLTAMAGGLVLIVAAVNLLPKDAALKTLGMLGLATALVVIAAALKIMGSMSWTEMGIALISLAGSLVVITAAMMFMKGAIPGAAALIIVAGALAILAPVLKTLGAMSIGEMVKSLIMLAGALAVIGLAGYVLAPVVPAILGLAASVTLFGVGVLAAGVGVVALAAGITALGAALGVAGAGIVAFVAGIIGLIPFLCEQVGIGIIKICETIAGSLDAICGAITTIVLAAVDALVTCIPAIAEGAFQLIVGLLEILIEYLPQIVPLLTELVVSLLGLLAESLPTIMPAIFGFIGAVFENIAANLSMITDPLIKLFGGIFQMIADIVGPIVEAVIAPILTVLVDLIVGCVEALAPYMPMICETITTVTTVICDAIVKIVQTLAPYIPEITSLVETIVNAFVSIVDQISPIIDSISGLIEKIGTAITDILGAAGDVVKDFGEAVKTGLEGVADVFDSAFGGVADVIESVGGVIEKFLDGVSGIIDSIGDAALKAGEGFKKFASGIKTITELNLLDMAASLASVSDGIKNISSNADGITNVSSGLQDIIDTINGFKKNFTTAGKNLVTGLASGINAQISEAKSKTKTMIETVLKTITDHKGKFKTAGKQLIEALIKGIASNTSNAKTKTKAVAEASLKTVKGFEGKFKTAGKNLVTGFAKGISAQTFEAKAKAKAMARAALDAAKEALDENSPSKEMYKVGRFAGMGFVNAFGDYESKASKAGSGLANASVTGMTNIISKISDFINSDIDAQPTIRPVLDLSDVRSGAGSIGSLFSQRALSVNASSVGAISASMAAYQNGQNSDELVSTIKALRKDISDMPRNTYSINGITYDDGSNISEAVQSLVRAARIERRT